MDGLLTGRPVYRRRPRTCSGRPGSLLSQGWVDLCSLALSIGEPSYIGFKARHFGIILFICFPFQTTGAEGELLGFVNRLLHQIPPVCFFFDLFCLVFE